jgi:chromosomal replication initiation ATPase DnaA
MSAQSISETAVPDLLATGALVIEDLTTWHLEERALFHLINLAREQRASVLFTARSAPSAWPIALPDLASRLREIPVVMLEPPDDALLRAVLIKLFADRQLTIDEGLIAYLVTRMERSFAAARATVAALDREALQQHRPVTRALAGELFRDPDA